MFLPETTKFDFTCSYKAVHVQLQANVFICQEQSQKGNEGNGCWCGEREGTRETERETVSEASRKGVYKRRENKHWRPEALSRDAM